MWYLIGLSVILFGLFLYGQYRKQKKYASQKDEVDGVLIQLIQNHPEIQYSKQDSISYFGSITHDDQIYNNFKSLGMVSDKDLNAYFSKTPYNDETDNLLVYKIVKKNTKVSYQVIVLDPIDMQRSFSIYEILGPFAK